MKPLKKLVAFIPPLILFGACTQNNDEPDAMLLNPAPEHQESIGIDPSARELSANDAKVVANIFKAGGDKSRSLSVDSPKSVVTITDDEGRPALYAVNYTDGYIIVSATKSVHPIQAIVEHGTFSLNDAPSGRDVVVNEIVEAIEFARKKSIIEDTKPLWLKYEKRSDGIANMLSRAIDPNLTDARGELKYKLESQGYEVFDSWEQTEDLPSSVINRFKEEIQRRASEFAEETEQDAQRAWLMAIKSESIQYETKPQLTTLWSQNDPYDLAVPGYKRLGCVTIAVAQLMRFYKRPSSIAWEAMPNVLYRTVSLGKDEIRTTDPSQTNDPSGTLVNFLATLRTQLKVNDRGGSNIDNALNTLRSYGYDAYIKGEPYEFPCYTRGEDKNIGEGHAWIIDGSRHWDGSTEYILYFPSEAEYYKYSYEEIDRVLKPGVNFYHDYMNWGWGGYQNGWFLRHDISIVEGDFSSDRKYITIKK